MKIRQGEVRRNTANRDERTVELVWTTGAAVRRFSFDTYEPYDEVLEVSARAIDLSRLQSGAPVLDSHRKGSTADQVAVVESAWLELGKGLALVRFPKVGTHAASDRIFEMVHDGIIRNVSVGYLTMEVDRTPPTGANDVETQVATRWQPYEISFVPVPADAGAQVRSGGKLRSNAARRMKLRQAVL